MYCNLRWMRWYEGLVQHFGKFHLSSCGTLKLHSIIKRIAHIGVWKRPPCKKKLKVHPPWLRYLLPQNMSHVLKELVKVAIIFTIAVFETFQGVVDDVSCCVKHPQYWKSNCWFFQSCFEWLNKGIWFICSL